MKNQQMVVLVWMAFRRPSWHHSSAPSIPEIQKATPQHTKAEQPNVMWWQYSYLQRVILSSTKIDRDGTHREEQNPAATFLDSFVFVSWRKLSVEVAVVGACFKFCFLLLGAPWSVGGAAKTTATTAPPHTP